jgi:hypothetical protein
MQGGMNLSPRGSASHPQRLTKNASSCSRARSIATGSVCL